MPVLHWVAQIQSQFTEISRVILDQDWRERSLRSESESNNPQKLQRLDGIYLESKGIFEGIQTWAVWLDTAESCSRSLAPIWQEIYRFCGLSTRTSVNSPSPSNDSYNDFHRVTGIISFSGSSSGTSTEHAQWWVNRALGRETGTEYGWMNKGNYEGWRGMERIREKSVLSAMPSKVSFLPLPLTPHPQTATVEGRIFCSAITFMIHMIKK